MNQYICEIPLVICTSQRAIKAEAEKFCFPFIKDDHFSRGKFVFLVDFHKTGEDGVGMRRGGGATLKGKERWK